MVTNLICLTLYNNLNILDWYIYIYILARVVAYVLKFTNYFEYKTDLKRKKYPKITQVFNKRRYGKKSFTKAPTNSLAQIFYKTLTKVQCCLWDIAHMRLGPLINYAFSISGNTRLKPYSSPANCDILVNESPVYFWGWRSKPGQANADIGW